MIDFIILFIISFGGTYYIMPHSIRKLRESGYVAKDMYKIGTVEIPTNVGIILLFTSFISISLFPLVARIFNLLNISSISLSDLSDINLAILLVVSIFSLYGLVDDLVDIGRKMKLILPIVFSYPLISFIDPSSLDLYFVVIDLDRVILDNISWSDIFKITIIPVYVMVVSNLVNMHSGYNGLQSGLSFILLSAVSFESWQDGKLDKIIPTSAFLGALFCFWLFNKYPSRIFEGNIGSLLYGSLLGCIIVVQEYWWFGFFILIPHIFNFFLWLVWLYLMKKHPETYLMKDGRHRKFGYTNEEGILKVPNRLTLKWIPNYYFDINEPSTVNILYLVTFIFSITGIILF